MKSSNLGNYLEEFVVGDVIDHSLSKTIFESDNNLFSLLTMNHHPLHINQHFAETSTHGKIIVVGTLVFSLVVGMTVPDISGKAIANLGYDSVRHLAPVFIGDTIYAKTRIVAARKSETKSDRGIVEVETTGYNQFGAEIIQFSRKVLIMSKQR